MCKPPLTPNIFKRKQTDSSNSGRGPIEGPRNAAPPARLFNLQFFGRFKLHFRAFFQKRGAPRKDLKKANNIYLVIGTPKNGSPVYANPAA